MKDNIKALRAVCRLASIAILETPREGARRGTVRRELLNEIEDALVAAGYDMPAARAHYAASIKADNKASREKTDALVLAKYPAGTRVQNARWNDSADRFAEGVVAADGTGAKGRLRAPVFVNWTDGHSSWVSAYDLDAMRSNPTSNPTGVTND